VVSADRPPREAERRALTVLRGLLATVPAADRQGDQEGQEPTARRWKQKEKD
jgi:hypothetical protein